MNNKEGSAGPPPSRRKFIRGIGLLSAFSALAALAGRALPVKRRVLSCVPEKKKKTVRMLTQDGKLVEIDESLLPPGLSSTGGKKITKEELQNWIKK